MIIFNLIWSILRNLFVVKREKVKNDLIYDVDCVHLTSGCCPTIMRRQTT